MKLRFTNKMLSWLLSFSMIIGLLSGVVLVKGTSEAAVNPENRKVELGKLVKDKSGKFYTYPDAEIKEDPDREGDRYQYLTVMVDSGYLTVEKGYETLNGTAVQGIAYRDNTDTDYLDMGYDNVKAGEPYEAINVDIGKRTAKTVLDDYIQHIHFTTSAIKPQKVRVTATTASDTLEMIAHVRDANNQDKTFELYYFNGHFYGFVDSGFSWTDAFKRAQDEYTEFAGSKGYLATLTSRAEDRFIYETFSEGKDDAPEGWIGATRATANSNGEYVNIASVTKPNIERVWYDGDPDKAGKLARSAEEVKKYLKWCQDNMIWSWVSGPEAGQAFGYQNAVCGDGLEDANGQDDGGFVAYDGMFSNWNNPDYKSIKDQNYYKVEPNGGITTGDEAYGYFGAYPYGRWNDHPDNSKRGFYIEYDGASDGLEKEGHLVYTEDGKSSDDIITDEDFFGKVFNPGPVIENTDKTGKTTVGTVLNANIDSIDFVGYDRKNPGNNGYTIEYQWFIMDEDGTLVPIKEQTIQGNEVKVAAANGKTYTLTENTLGEALVVRVTEYGPDGNVVGVGTSAPYQTGDDIYINGRVTIKEKDVDEDGNLIVEADVSQVRPAGAQGKLKYKWYKRHADGTLEEIPGADDKDLVIKDGEIPEGTDLVVEVTPEDDSGYEGKLTSDPYHVKEVVTGKPEITPQDNKGNVVGAVLKAVVTDGKVTDKKTKTATFQDNDFDYQWYILEDDGTLTVIPGANKQEYTLTSNTIDKKLVVSATVKDSNEKYYGIVYSDREKGYDTSLEEKIPIEGKPKIEQVGDTLQAVVDDITPKEAQSDLEYEWFVDGEPVEGEHDSTLDLDEHPEIEDGSQVTVKVRPKKDNPRYTGEAESDPAEVKRQEAVEGKEKIKGQLDIVNQTTDDEGLPVHRAGSKLYADPANVYVDSGEDCHGSLSYQWYVYEDGEWKEIPGATDQTYTLTDDTVDKTLSVRATATGDKYYGDVTSAPYDTSRSNSDINVDPSKKKGRKSIFVRPSEEDTKYRVSDADSDLVPDNMDVWLVDEDGNRVKNITGDPDYYDPEDGYYTVEPGQTVEFEVDDDKDYILREKTVKRSNTNIIGEDIPDDNIKAEKKEDGTITIIVDPAKENTVYAVLKKEGDHYVPVTVTKDPVTGEYVYDPNGSQVWSDGDETIVTFTQLPGDGTYKVVAVSKDLADSISPDDVIGGSTDIVGSELKPGDGSDKQLQSSDKDFTDAEKKKAEDMLNGSFTNPKDGSIITDVDDYTRDKILESEKEWNKLTDREKAAVNAKLKELGSKYTYEQLLEMAKNWKIPFFKMNKYMKKGTKSKLKLVKCSGATVLTTSSNEKVATINKKGVIKAKKVGKATCTITVLKGDYSNRLQIKVIVKKKFKNASELKKFKGKIKTPTLLLNKKREVKKSTKVKIYGLAKGSKVTYKSLNKKVAKINKKGKYTAKKKGKTLILATVKQNNKKYLLYLNLSVYKNKKAKKSKK